MRMAGILALGGLMLAGGALAGDVAQGRKVAGMCRTCHGLNGLAKIPIAPNIGGEPASYITEQLENFREGRREHEMMSVVAAGLSDAQIADVSAWFAAQRASATLSADAQAAPEACVACHGADGIGLAEDAPNLAGETNIYLETQLKAFRSGKRTHEIMSVVAEGLSDAEIRAAADWYAAVALSIAPPER